MTLKIDVIGAGWIADPHASGWCALEGKAEVVGVADVDEAAARRLVDSSGAKAYTDYRDLLTWGDLDAVDILVPPHLHVEIVSAAAEAGVHSHDRCSFSLKFESLFR